ncbi:hypothetical protein D3C71_1271550 [compost metagenome]
MEVVGTAAVIGADEALHGVRGVIQTQFLTEQVAVLLAQNHLVVHGRLVEVQAGVVVRAGIGREAGQGPVIVQAVIDLGADGVLAEFVVRIGIG